jgi:hypothetical protein
MAGGIVGREAELDAFERFLDTLTAGPAGLVIDGEAGIGKTTIWLEPLTQLGPPGGARRSFSWSFPLPLQGR